MLVAIYGAVSLAKQAVTGCLIYRGGRLVDAVGVGQAYYYFRLSDGASSAGLQGAYT